MIARLARVRGPAFPPLACPPAMLRTILALAFVAALSLASNVAVAEQFKLTKTEDGITVELDGKLFTRYIFKSASSTVPVSKPVMWPVVGPSGKELTRGYPLRAATPDEKADHVHHRSFWFDHGDVNGVSFWDETPKSGSIVQRELVRVEEGKTGLIVTRNDWVDVNGKKVCTDERIFTFGTVGESRYIDCDLTVFASEGPVVFGDTKEGAFGVRVAGPLSVDSKKGGKIVTSEGLEDAAAWGKPAAWVDYYGPLDGEVVGIAILNHPSSFRYPTTWHVRTYGLFAANPFGLKGFDAKNESGAHTIPKGEQTNLRYRVILHSGDAKQADIAKRFEEYAKVKKAQE